MIRLLKAGLFRLKKDILFWIFIFLTIGLAILTLVRYVPIEGITLDSALNEFLIYIGLFIAIFVSIFVGKEHSQGIIRNKIIEYKFEDKGYLYKMFAKIILSDKKTCNFIKKYDVIIPVPISKKRKKKRGYNQSELVANELAQKLNQDIWTDIIIKKKDNKPQSELNKLERIKNVEDIYEINKPIEVKNKKVLLLDDIYTTGSTVNEIARKLKQNQTQEIGVITLAKD